MPVNTRTKKLAVIAIFSAIAWILASLIKLPIVPALAALNIGYEPKDIILVIAGFLYGPIVPLVMAALLSAIEMITTSGTGWLGAVQNFISSCAFGCTAALFYKRWHNIKGAVAGLITGTLFTTIIMMPSNYILAPIYLNYLFGIEVSVAREEVKKLLLTGFLPFNLIKYSLNTAFTLLVYKRLKMGLEAAKMLPAAEKASNTQSLKTDIAIISISSAMIVLCAVVVFLLGK